MNVLVLTSGMYLSTRLTAGQTYTKQQERCRDNLLCFFSINLKCLVPNKSSQMTKQRCSFQLQVCLNMCDPLVDKGSQRVYNNIRSALTGILVASLLTLKKFHLCLISLVWLRESSYLKFPLNKYMFQVMNKSLRQMC